MFVKYANDLYCYRDLKETKLIVTHKEKENDNEFYKHRSVWVKKISSTDPNIQDIFDVKFFVKWDSHMEYVTTKWNIGTENYRPDGRVHLYHEGHLPEWYIEEKGLCSRDIEADVIEGYSVKYIYKTKDGQKLDESLEIEKEVDRQEFEKLIEMYEESNI